jgi:hypothetical protein
MSALPLKADIRWRARRVRFVPKALDRQIRRLFALENPAGIYSDEAMSICNARPVAHQADRDYGWLLDRSGQGRRLRVMNPGGADVKNLTTPMCGPAQPLFAKHGIFRFQNVFLIRWNP